MKKNFILGVGCQKGGTTWLYSQLCKSRNVDMGFMKEYHIFDALYVPECVSFLNNKIKRMQNVPEGINALRKEKQLIKHLGFYSDTQNYYDYFDSLIYKGGSEVTTVGDITPSYSALPKEALSEIKSEFEARGFKVKVIFLMRDPIERIWSMVRMNRRDKLRANPDLILPDERENIEADFKYRWCEIRTKYEITISNLEAIFDSNDIFYGFYEELFEEQSISNLSSFLDLNEFPIDINHKVNVSEKNDSSLELDEELGSRIFNHYKETYEYCQNRFGVKELWNGFKYL
jgi:hypothetical protein